MPNPFALITGASHGIGEEYARQLAALGYDVLLVARDEERLKRVAEDISRRACVQAMIEVMDLSQPGAGQRLHAATLRHRRDLDVLINNAGFGLYGPFVSHPRLHIEQMLHLHMTTIVETMRLILPGMITRRSGVIINVASLAGLLPIPYCAEYAATKAFLISFSEAVAWEVSTYGVTIQVCCPGQTQTDFHSRAGFCPPNPLRSQTPREVVKTSLAALEARTPVVTIGWTGKLSALIIRLLPQRMMMKIVSRRMRPSSPT